MGILNITPDSFYPVSRVQAVEEAVAAGVQMVEAGADILDVGGESTRPGSEEVPAKDEASRVLPVIKALADKVQVPISIDTRRAETAQQALDAGATILNDVYALRDGDRMLEVAAKYPLVVMMHMLGDSPKTMQSEPHYRDVVGEISDFFKERLAAFKSAGGQLDRVWLDPGIGFGKTLDHNLEILSRLESFTSLGRPILVGASRKSFLGRILGSEDSPAPVEQRLGGSLAAACRAADAGAMCVRVHDVAETYRALEVWARMRQTR
jgi:dihydropteroate synthase